MFDKLVESDMTGADLKPRRRIFIASFTFVAVLFATAVVAGIYAADFTLGTDNFDVAEMLAPVTPTEPEREPEPPRTQPQPQRSAQSDQTTRQTHMARVDEPTIAPTEVSVDKNKFLSRPIGAYEIKNGPEVNAGIPYDSGRPDGPGGSSSVESARDESDEVVRTTPPPVPPKIEKKVTTKTGGVLNGSAIALPKPVYSAAAIAVQAKGAVNVQITIDETGKVISAKAATGHVLLRPAAEAAAWKARFYPTTLSGVPVKVTGVIVYNFQR